MGRLRAWEFNFEKFNLRVQSSISEKFNLGQKFKIQFRYEKFNFKSSTLNSKVQFTEVQFRVQNWTKSSKFNLAEYSEVKFNLGSHSLERLGELSAQATKAPSYHITPFTSGNVF